MATVQSTPNVPVGRVQPAPTTREEKKIIFASSLGTVFEWYDFYLYGSLAAITVKQFFPGLDSTAGFIFALLAFVADFLVHPFGALVSGRLGDVIGRKYTFLVTIVIMGTSTFIVGLLPSYGTIDVAALVILIALRMLQGLALGGEYSGAATYVAEHAPYGRRGAYTSWIQTTAALGLFLSLVVILAVRELTGKAFGDWGRHIPLLVLILLLATSVYIRLPMSESPVFQKMKAEGKTSKAPLTEVFSQWRNLKIIILTLFGLTTGQAVAWYTGQFHVLFFLTQVLKVDTFAANVLIVVAFAIGTPFPVFFSSFFDRIGHKKIIMIGCLLTMVTYFPLFKTLTHYANPALERAQQTAQITIIVDPKECSSQGSPIAREVDSRLSCDIAKRTLAQSSASYETVEGPAGTVASVSIAGKQITSLNATCTADGQNFDAGSKAKVVGSKKQVSESLEAANYPVKADPAQINTIMVLVILMILVIYVTMVYGPTTAILVKMFPTRIRYSSMSLPYHISNDWFGGLLSTISFALVAQNGNIYHSLWYPIWTTAITFVIGVLFVRETKDVDIHRNN